MTLWRWLLPTLLASSVVLLWLHGSCRLGHSWRWHHGRNAKGQPCRLCDRCQRPMGAILAGEMIKTKLPQSVGGAVTTKAVRERNNITEFPRVSER